jgi:hypothetical protein
MEIQEKKRLSSAQTRALKLALDAVMLILLVLMYKKQVISMSFHEVGGLALIGLFVVHHLVNMRWIGAATKRLFAKGTPGMVRARYIVDALLLVAFLAIGVTGLMINKTLFATSGAGYAKTLHYFASAVAIILMGVHLGLHTEYILGKLFKRGTRKVAKVALAVVFACVVVFGGYSVFTTQFVSFLSAPLQAGQFSHGAFQPSREIAQDGVSGELPSDISELPAFSDEGDAAQPSQGGGRGAYGGGRGQGQGARDGLGQGAGDGQGLGNGQGLGESHQPSFGNAALLIAQYVSIIALFGAATYGIVKLTAKKRNGFQDEAIAVNSTEE